MAVTGPAVWLSAADYLLLFNFITLFTLSPAGPAFAGSWRAAGHVIGCSLRAPVPGRPNDVYVVTACQILRRCVEVRLAMLNEIGWICKDPEKVDLLKCIDYVYCVKKLNSICKS